MTNNLTGLTALIVAISGLITAIGTIIGIFVHTRGHNGKHQKAAKQPPPAQALHVSAENAAYRPSHSFLSRRRSNK